MMFRVAVCAAICVFGALPLAYGDVPTPKLYIYNQTTDHFNFGVRPEKFAQRVLIYEDKFDPVEGSIVFYCGNEGDIYNFYNNTGWAFDTAEDLKSLVVFAEHRYYGESYPFGEASFDKQNIGLLNVEQTLADFTEVLSHIQNVYIPSRFPSASQPPVIAIGGSYGGMLATWMRMKYPEVVDMALAASAPMKYPAQEAPPLAFFNAITNTFRKADPNCPAAVRTAFSRLLDLSSTPAGLTQITKSFNVCKPLTSSDVNHLVLWVKNAFTSMTMCDYPYPTNFLAPLPAFPVTVACKYLATESDVLTGLAKAATLFYGNSSCNDIYTQFIECADQTGCGLGNDGTAWDYQVCTELIIYASSNNVTDMFPQRDWNAATLKEYCQSKYDVTPRPEWFVEAFGPTSKLPYLTSRIIFSNGLLDPWSAGGLMQDLSDTLLAVTIDLGAHHLDLRGKDAQDPDGVIVARQRELEILKDWVAKARSERQVRSFASNHLSPRFF